MGCERTWSIAHRDEGLVRAAAHDVAALAAEGQTGGTSVRARPLEGVRVADFSRVLSGPYATMVLGDLGADVVKVERPGEGDETRGWGPPFAGDESAYFLAINRNKRSIALDLASDEDRAVARRLIAHSHIMIENFRPGTAARLGLGYDDVRALNPAIVYASITGFGEDGPMRDAPGYDFLAQAMGGVMSVTGEADGDPQKTGVAIADITAGMFAVIGILAALRDAEATGQGRRVHVSLLEAQIAWLANQGSSWLTASVESTRMGNAHPSIVPYRVFHANDEPFVLFCTAIERDDLATTPDYATNADRVRNRASLETLLQGLFTSRARADWLALFSGAGIPASPINSISEVFADEQVRALGLVAETDGVRTVRSPISLDGARLPPLRRPPRLGEHTAEVLAELNES